MTGEAGHDRIPPPASVEKRIDLVGDRFEMAWKTNAKPRIETFLEGWQEPARSSLLHELVMLDLEYRWQRAASRYGIEGRVSQHIVHGSNSDSAAPLDFPLLPLLEDYVRMFPELGSIDELPAELIALEYEIRCRWGERPGHDEYLKRFGHHSSELIRKLSEENGKQDAREAPASTNGIKSTRTLPPQAAVRTRCPYCHHLIDLPDETSADTFRCQNCHHAIDLVGGTSTRRNDVNSRRLAHFELVDELGTGGFGVVWKARDVRLDRIVALKIPRHNRLGAEDIEKFLREARTAAQLKHPHIVRIHEVGREDDSFYIVSDYIEGLPLDRWLADQPMTPREAAELCRELAAALQYAHAEGIIHRDLKPGNIMVDPQGRPHIMDFGLAKREVGEITMTLDGAILGTPAYMSPEQAGGKGHKADRRSDIYSLGVILFELLTGELPFRGERQMLMVQILNDEPPSPRHLNNHVPRDLETICLKCLEKEPDRRYQTAAELAADLDRQLAGEPILARPIGRIGKLSRWCQRNAVLSGLLAVLVVTLVSGMIAVTSQWRRAERNAADEKLARGRAVEAERQAQSEAERATKAEDAQAQALQRTRRHLYVAHMNQVQQAWESGEVGVVHELLGAHRPRAGEEDFRGFEWYYWWRISHEYSAKLLGHADKVTALAYSPDGQTVASASADGTVKLWEVSTGEMQASLEGHDGRVSGVAFAPDGRSLATAGVDATVKLWDVGSIECKQTLKGHTFEVAAVTFSRDGRSLFSIGRTLNRWDAESGELKQALQIGHSVVSSKIKEPIDLAFSPDGKTVVADNGGGRAALWDVATGERQATFWDRYRGGIMACAVSNDGLTAATGSSHATVVLWDTKSGQLKRVLEGHTGHLFTIAFSPDDTILATAGRDLSIRLWDVASGQLLRVLRGHSAPILALAFSPDGRTLISGGRDTTLTVWDIFRPQPPAVIHACPEYPTNVIDLEFSPDSQKLATSGPQSIKLWDVSTGEFLSEFAPGVAGPESVAFAPDGRFMTVGVGGNLVTLWDLKSGAESTIEIAKTDFWDAMWVCRCLAVSPDSMTIATNGDDGALNLWDAATGQLKKAFSGHKEPPLAVAFSPDGSMLASGSRDGAVKLWDLKSGRLQRSLGAHRARVMSVAFSPDGEQLASAGDDGKIRLWNIGSGLEESTLSGHAEGVTGVTYAPDGKTLASSSGDSTIKLWDVVTGEPKTTLRGHTDYCYCARFSPDGSVLASGSLDGTVRLWRAAGEQFETKGQRLSR